MLPAGDGTVVRIAGRPTLDGLVSDDAGDATVVGASSTGVSAVVDTGSTGVSAVEPLVLVTRGGRTAFLADASLDGTTDLAALLDEGFDAVAEAADAVAEHDPETTALPTPDLQGFETGTRTVLSGCGWRRPTSPDDHEAAGGFVDVDPQAIRDVGAGLRGRGWADWCRDQPIAAVWETARAADGDATVVVNAHGSDADELLVSSAPFEVLEGAAATARAVDADRVVVYVSEAAEAAVETVRAAAAAYPSAPVSFDVVTGPSEYRAAEPTMALEAIEGNHRLEARLRPPGPEEVGLDGQPTVVHTPRTLAHLAVALRRGEPASTRLLTVSGDVAAPATVELDEREPVAAALDAVDVAGDLKAACVGGRFGGVTDDLSVACAPEPLVEAGLGTEGVVEVLTADRCLVEFVGRRARFAAEANCGRCVPCREGSTQLANLLRDVYDGRFDPGGIEELAGVMETSSICAFGVEAARPARTAVAAFASEFRAHADGHCPAGSCPSMEVA